MDIKAKESASKVFNTVWSIAKKYSFENLSESDWENYINETNEKFKEIKAMDNATEHLYRGMILSLTNYMERRNGYKSETMDIR